MPGGAAEGAELLDAGGAGDGHALGLVAGADVADGVAARAGAPGPARVQGDFCNSGALDNWVTCGEEVTR